MIYNNSYNSLSDEDKILESIKFIAIGHPLPEVYEEYLKSVGLYEAIVNPKEVK